MVEDAYPSRRVGVDPGRKNIVMMVDEEGNFLRYSAAQRRFESGLPRYEGIWKVEKRNRGVEAEESSLSEYTWRTNDAEMYMS